MHCKSWTFLNPRKELRASGSVSNWRIRERAYTLTTGFPTYAFQMSGLQLSDPFPAEGAHSNKGRQTRPAVFINPWMASATLAQSLELTFSPKATSSFCLERDCLSTRPNWPLSQGTFNIWQWLKEMASITKCPLPRHLLSRKLSGDQKISPYHCGNAWYAPVINLRPLLWAYTQRAEDALY